MLIWSYRPEIPAIIRDDILVQMLSLSSQFQGQRDEKCIYCMSLCPYIVLHEDTLQERKCSVYTFSLFAECHALETIQLDLKVTDIAIRMCKGTVTRLGNIYTMQWATLRSKWQVFIPELLSTSLLLTCCDNSICRGVDSYRFFKNFRKAFLTALIPIPIPKWLKISVIPESEVPIFEVDMY